MLPETLHDKPDKVQVNPTLQYDQSYSTFISLADCQVKWRLPPSAGTRKRVSRDRFRLMLLEDPKDQLVWGNGLSRLMLLMKLPLRPISAMGPRILDFCSSVLMALARKFALCFTICNYNHRPLFQLAFGNESGR